MPEEGGGVHPGSWIGDSVEEFKKLPTWGKVGVVAGLGVVAYLGYRAYQNQQSSASNSPGQGTDTSTLGGSQSPYPTAGGLPILPSGVNPVYDPNGNPIAFQQGPPNGPPPQPIGPPVPTGAPPPASSGNCPPDMHKCGKMLPPNNGCCCNKKNMINLGDHCVPIGSQNKSDQSTRTMHASTGNPMNSPAHATPHLSSSHVVRKGTPVIVEATPKPPQPVTPPVHGQPIVNNPPRKLPPGSKPPQPVTPPVRHL